MSVAILTATLLLLCTNVRPIKAQVDDVNCDDYPCFNGGTCIRGDMGSSDICSCPPNVFQPFCTPRCHQSMDGDCVNDGLCLGGICFCPPDFAAPTCEAKFAAYLSPISVTVMEGNFGNRTVNVQVCRQPATQEISLRVYTSVIPSSADIHIDFINISPMPGQEVTLTEGQTCTPVAVTILSDLIDEDDESFQLNLMRSGSDVYIVPGQQLTVITITDDDDPDVDECTTNTHSCDNSTSDCQNLIGTYQCNCKGGFTGRPYIPPDQSNCKDVDECTTNTHSCDNSTSDCQNLIGTYMCSCKDGFIGGPYTPPDQSNCTEDISPPVIENCPSDQFTTVPLGNTNGTSNWNEPAATDDSGGALMLFRSHTPGSFFPVGTTAVNYTYEDQAGNQAVCTFNVTVEEDCTLLNSTTQCDASTCTCNKQICDSQTGRCEASCNIFQCPAVIASQSLSQVNPNSSVEISCILEGSTAVVTRLDIRLSSSGMSILDSGISSVPPPVITDGRKEAKFIVNRVLEDDQFFCVLSQFRVISAINVTGFVHELPHISEKPNEAARSNTSITISWRSWDQSLDVGDPPVVAYIPYYKMNTSQDWINGTVITTDKPLEYTASNLESDRHYTFSIATVREGEGGEGPRGPPITIKTLCTVSPELVPSSVSSRITDFNDVSVSWRPPVNVNCSTGITQFTIYYEINGDSTTRQEAGTTDGTTHSFIVDGSLLESGRTYNFYVTLTTDQESDIGEGSSGSQLAFRVDMIMETGSFAVYLVALVVPILLLCIAVIIIFRRRQRKTLTNTYFNGAGDAKYDNARVTDDHEDYISLKGQSRYKGAKTLQDVSQTASYENIAHDADATSLTAKSQRSREREQSIYMYDDVSGNEGARNLPSVPELNEQRQYGSEYRVDEMFKEYAGVYFNTRNLRKPSPPAPLKVTDFKNFMKRERSEVILEIIQQFMALQSGKQHPWKAALKVQNRGKNFFSSLLPYDHSRVKLDTDGSSGSSDYINASYIKNNHGKTSFIAAQGPRDATKDDFWKMVWQENVEIIVMLVDTTEITEQQYWPRKVNTSLQFGDITVLLMESIGFKTHTVRKMNVLKGKKRTLTWISHYEIPCWRYGGVPSDPGNLISVIKQIKTHHEGNKHLLVHCSNGVGATGTFIALYDLMDVIKTKKEVSVFDVVKGMRKDRIDMVHNKLQYLFIFDALLEAMLSLDFQMPSDQLKKLDLPAIKKKSRKEFETLKQNHQIEQDMSLMAGSSSGNKHKNRFHFFIPIDRYRPVLSSLGTLFGFSDYVNATIVKDISERDFIMTQSPLPSTVEDFWRLVFDYDCTSIVMMNNIDDSDESLTEYWPKGHNAAASHGLISVTCKTIDEHDAFTKRQFQVNHKRSQKSILVDHFSFNGWTRSGELDVCKLRKFINYTKPIKGPGPGLVHCINGVGLSSVYVTVISELERIEKEGTIHIFGTVRRLRKKCPFAILTKEEYCLCYKLLWDHLNNPEEYAVVF